jgi:uncharacterized membrane protein YfcA
MAPRTVATANVFVSLLLGGIGFIAPQAMATAFGVNLDQIGEVLARLACASYVAFGVLAWLARDLTDPGAWRAVAGASAVGWTLGAAVTAVGRASGLGGVQGWLIVAIQVVFAVAWVLVYARASSTSSNPLPRSART